jgi:hypothetical protein
MTKKAENRFLDHNRKHFNRKADERRAWNLMERQNREIEQVKEENAALKARIAKLEEGYKKRGLLLTMERENTVSLNQDIDKFAEEASRWRAAFLVKHLAHQKLSAIVRLGIDPDRYHHLRSECAELYPKLFEKKEQQS